MNDESKPSISELLANHSLINAAITRAVRAAVLDHVRAGRPVATWENGKVVWIQPAEILVRFGEAKSA
jgi:hypothetical protein